jgi:hypothetical protein
MISPLIHRVNKNELLQFQEEKYLVFMVFLVYKELQGTGCFEWMNLETDEDEHSIEMHLPYIAKVFEKYLSLKF